MNAHADLLAAIRKMKGWSVPRLAKASGVSESMIRRWESGKNNPTSPCWGYAFEALTGDPPSDPPPSADQIHASLLERKALETPLSMRDDPRYELLMEVSTLGLSQRQLAQSIGVNESTISRLLDLSREGRVSKTAIRLAFRHELVYLEDHWSFWTRGWRVKMLGWMSRTPASVSASFLCMTQNKYNAKLSSDDLSQREMACVCRRMGFNPFTFRRKEPPRWKDYEVSRIGSEGCA